MFSRKFDLWKNAFILNIDNFCKTACHKDDIHLLPNSYWTGISFSALLSTQNYITNLMFDLFDRETNTSLCNLTFMPLITDNTTYFYLYLLDISSRKLVFVSFVHFILRLFVFQLMIYNNMNSNYWSFLTYLRT